jgi:hypothetical protein
MPIVEMIDGAVVSGDGAQVLEKKVHSQRMKMVLISQSNGVVARQ